MRIHSIFINQIIIDLKSMRLIRLNPLYHFSNIPYKSALEKHYRKNDLIRGYCTPADSQKYSIRNKEVNNQHWRNPVGISEHLTLSSLGIGTYNGQPSNEYDYQMFRALADSIQSGGINIIDTCALYRYGKSQKVINAVINYLVKEQSYSRNQLFISTKCGYIPNDIDSNLKEEDFIRLLTSQNIISPQEIVNNIHCVSPNFLDFSIEKSRLGLGLQTIDVVYLNNFSQAHLPVVGEEITYKRLKQAFAKFQQMRQDNRIRYYGLCSYVGLRSPKTETGVHFQLQKAIQIAKQLAGQKHGFRFLMVPFSLGTPEIILKWQQYFDGKLTKDLRVFDIAEAEKINIVSCSPLFQGKVANLPFQSKKIDYISNNSAKHLQLIRSFPSSALLTSLVGMTEADHIKQNLQVINHPRLTEKQWKQILPIPEQ